MITMESPVGDPEGQGLIDMNRDLRALLIPLTVLDLA